MPIADSKMSMFLLCSLVIPSTLAWGQNGTYVGGEAVYIDAETKKEHSVPGAELTLISGALKKDGGLVPENRILDRDHTASTSNGDPLYHEGTFVLIADGNHQVITILYYPWPRDDSDPNKAPPFRSRVFTSKPSGKGNQLRAKVRLNLSATNSSFTNAKAVSAAIQTALAARGLASLLEIPRKILDSNLDAEIDRVLSMIPPEKFGMLFEEMIVVMQKEGLGKELELMAIKREQLAKNPGRLEEIRRSQQEAWDHWNKLDPSKRSFNWGTTFPMK